MTMISNPLSTNLTIMTMQLPEPATSSKVFEHQFNIYVQGKLKYSSSNTETQSYGGTTSCKA